MRKIFLFAAALLTSIAAMSEEVGGINYQITDEDNAKVQVIAKDPVYSGDVTIPAKVTIGSKEYDVTAMADQAFYRCEDLTSVVLPTGIQSIGSQVFSFCHNLATINFPEGLESIGDDAFWECTSLTSVTLPSTIKSIQGYAFEECHQLASINLPNGLEFLGDYVFAGDSVLGVVKNDSVLAWIPFNLTSYEVPEGIKAVAGAACYHHDKLQEITLPSTLKEIGNSAFYQTGLTSVVIPNGVTAIHSGTFSYCYELTSVTIGNGVEIIYDDAFGDCTKLTNITWGTTGNLKEIYGGAFCNTGLTSVTVPEGVTRLKDYYGRGAFTGCKNLKTVSLPASLTVEIAPNTLKNCPIESITIASGNTVYDSRNNCNAIIRTESNELEFGFATTVIPASVKAIGYGAFQNCSGLTSIVIPEGVTYVDSYAFLNCTSLSSITIPSTVRRAGYQIFDGTALTEPIYNQYVFLYMPPTATQATGEYTVPAGIEQIAGYSFLNCENLTAIHLPASLKIVGNEAFWNCTGVTEMVIPDNVDSIGFYAFDYMENVTKITLPANLEHIGVYAFAGCNKLEQIICPAAVPAAIEDGNAYELPEDLNDPSSIKLYVPDLSVTAYEAAEGWQAFDVQPMSNVPTGVENTSADTKAIKRLVNGQLLIEKNGRIFNAQGQEVK